MIELWVEGYAATGESAKAHKCGDFDTDSLVEAVTMYRNTFTDQRSKDLINLDVPSFWGCKFFDNEIDARKNFG